MSELTQIRQRLKSIQTIEKITHAMRLISMSFHSKIKGKQESFSTYMKHVIGLLARVQQSAPEWKNPIVHPDLSTKKRLLVLLVGSQKGLCGNFNTTIFQFFNHEINKYQDYEIDLIPIGQKIIDALSKIERDVTVIASYQKLTTHSLFSIAHDIINILIEATPSYHKVIMISNEFKSFFLQLPHTTDLIPFQAKQAQIDTIDNEPYEWEHDTFQVLDEIIHLYLEASIQNVLIQSLLAEQAARFLTMDSATRNAETLLENTQLLYNKLRQARITKELTELIGSFE